MITVETKTGFKREFGERIREREESQLFRFTLVIISFLLSKDKSGEGAREMAQRLRAQVLLQRTRVQIPAARWQLTMVCSSSSRSSYTFF